LTASKWECCEGNGKVIAIKDLIMKEHRDKLER